MSLDDLFNQISSGIKNLNIIIKADVAGSAEAVKSSLLKLSNDEVKVNVIHDAVGGINEGDVMLATASIAIIFYKGTGLNSDAYGVNGEDNVVWTPGSTTTSRTLGVGLKHGNSFAWCLNSADAYSKNIKTIQCLNEGTAGAFTFTGDKDGSNNLEQIEAWEDVDDTTGEGAEDIYPAFYFAMNYCREILDGEGESRLEASGLENGWYLPSLAELYQIYACRADTTNGFDIDAASSLCGGDQFGTSAYLSSSQFDTNDNWARLFNFEDGWPTNLKKEQSSGYFGATHVCAIREFN